MIGFPSLSRRKPPPSYRLPDGLRVYAIGDIHGCDNLLAQVEARIVADLVARPTTGDTLVIFLGDYVDRGPASRAVIERLLPHRFAGMPARMLLGNHEAAMLAFLVDPVGAADWLDWGGADTLASYGVASPDPADRDAVRHAAATLAERLPLAHLVFLRELELSIVLGDFLFVHAGVRPGIALDRQKRSDLLFIREPFLAATRPFSHRVVHGHSIASSVELRPHRIGVDTGAFATGRLSAVAIERDDARVLADR